MDNNWNNYIGSAAFGQEAKALVEEKTHIIRDAIDEALDTIHKETVNSIVAKRTKDYGELTKDEKASLLEAVGRQVNEAVGEWMYNEVNGCD